MLCESLLNAKPGWQSWPFASNPPTKAVSTTLARPQNFTHPEANGDLLLSARCAQRTQEKMPPSLAVLQQGSGSSTGYAICNEVSPKISVPPTKPPKSHIPGAESHREGIPIVFSYIFSGEVFDLSGFCARQKALGPVTGGTDAFRNIRILHSPGATGAILRT